MTQNYWAVSRCGRALFLATPFGYGPRVAAEALARRLHLQLAAWNQSETLPTPDRRLRMVLNFGCEDAPRFESIFRVWIDCLVWLRSRWPDNVLGYDLILAETFFEQNGNLAIPEQLKHIPPLLSSLGTTGNSVMSDYILVSFGGVDTPFTQEIQRSLWPCFTLQALLKSVRKNSVQSKIVCCVPGPVRRELGALSEMSEIEVLSPNHNSFIQLLTHASLYVVQPGLYGPFEAFERQIPTVFSTPFSYTQILQARKYEGLGLLGEAPLWCELNEAIGSVQGDVGLEEMTCFRQIASWLRRFCEQGHFEAFDEWAHRVVAGRLVNDELTSKRYQHVRACAQFPETYLEDLASVLSSTYEKAREV